MPHEEINGVPIWYEEHGDPGGPVARRPARRHPHLPRQLRRRPPLAHQGPQVIGVELQGHGHTPDTGRAMSIERFADDVAELIDRITNGGPVDVWGFSIGALTATSLALRYPAKIRRLVLAASNIRPDGYHPEITAPEQDNPACPPRKSSPPGKPTTRPSRRNPRTSSLSWNTCNPSFTTSAAGPPTRSVDHRPHVSRDRQPDFVRLDHADEMLDLFPDCRLAVLPDTRHTEVMQRTDELRTLIRPFLS